MAPDLFPVKAPLSSPPDFHLMDDFPKIRKGYKPYPRQLFLQMGNNLLTGFEIPPVAGG